MVPSNILQQIWIKQQEFKLKHLQFLGKAQTENTAINGLGVNDETRSLMKYENSKGEKKNYLALRSPFKITVNSSKSFDQIAGQHR